MKAPRLGIHYPEGSLKAQQELRISVRLDSGWHINSDNPGDEFLVPTTLVVTAPGIEFGKARWPKPIKEYSQALKMELLSFADTFSIFVPLLKVHPQYDTLETQATLKFQACSNTICLAPAAATVNLTQESHNQTATSNNQASTSNNQASPSLDLKKNDSLEADWAKARQSAPSESNTQASSSLAWMLLFAFIGGLILNLMPCVLPVLSIKALSLAKQAKESRKTLTALSLSMTLGILVSFWILAGLVVIIQQAGGFAGWGFQFQNPPFLVFMAALMTLFALNLFGVFEIWLPSKAATGLSQASSRSGLAGAFFNGVLMTLLSTPCSAPFLGSAMGYAFSQPAPILFVFFTATGLGLAFPFVLLSLFPRALRWIPKPGMWMVRFKQFLGFLLLATATWLVWVLGKAVGIDAMGGVLNLLILLSLGAWLLGVVGSPGNPFWKVLLGWMLVAILGFGTWIAWVSPILEKPAPATPTCTTDGLPAKDAQGWYPWSPDIVQTLTAQGKTVFVDFTADWCLTCKTNEAAVLSQDTIQNTFKALDVALVKADWTRENADIGRALQSFGRSGVPLYVVYSHLEPANPIVLPEILTADLVLDALLQAGPSLE